MKRDKRELEGKTCIFNTQQSDSQLKKYDGKICIVLNRIDEKTIDVEDVGTMWLVELLDGYKIEAFADELEIKS